MELVLSCEIAIPISGNKMQAVRTPHETKRQSKA